MKSLHSIYSSQEQYKNVIMFLKTNVTPINHESETASKVFKSKLIFDIVTLSYFVNILQSLLKQAT